MNENLHEILIEAKDGPLTRGEWGNLMKQIREEKNISLLKSMTGLQI